MILAAWNCTTSFENHPLSVNCPWNASCTTWIRSYFCLFLINISITTGNASDGIPSFTVIQYWYGTVCSRKNGFSKKWVFRDFLRFLDACSISQKWVFEEMGFFFWASNLNTQKWFIFTREFLYNFWPPESFAQKWFFSRILDACSNSQKWVSKK